MQGSIVKYQNEMTNETNEVKKDIQRIYSGQSSLNKTMDHAFVKIDSKDKDLELKIAKFRPEKYGLASKEKVNDDLSN